MEKFIKEHKKLIFNIICLGLIAVALMYFQRKIILVDGSDDTIFLHKVQSMPYLSFISERYMTWSSRIGAESLIYFFVTLNLKIWKVLNVLMIFLLAFSITRVFKKTVSMVDFVFVLLTLGLIGQRVLTSSTFCFHGSFNYSWPAATGIFALIPLADYFFRSEKVKNNYSYAAYVLAIIYTVLSNEQMGLVLLGFYGAFFVYAKFRKISLSKELNIFLGLIVVLLLVVFLAPGNALRYHSEIARWYPDFKTISFSDHMASNLNWFFDEMFSTQRYLVMLLGFVSYAYYFQKTNKRNIAFEFLLALPIGIILVSGFSSYENMLFKFDSNPANNSLFIFAYWTAYLVMLGYLLCKIDEKKYVNGLIFAAGVATMLLMWASPTIFASANRVMLMCSVFLVVLINKIRLDSEFKVDKHLLAYSIFPIINMLLILDVWSKRFTIHY